MKQKKWYKREDATKYTTYHTCSEMSVTNLVYYMSVGE